MIRGLCNQVVFPLRQRAWRWRRRPYRERLETDVDQFFFSASIAQELSGESLGLNCFYYSILSQLSSELRPVPAGARHLDVGSMSFFYAPALASFFKQQSMPFEELIGIEADPKRLYRDFYRREDYARYYSFLAERSSGIRVRYQGANYLKQSFDCDLISCFFPFLYSDLSENWGLPPSFFSPEELYRKMSEESSQIILFHQGVEELADSKALIARLGAESLREWGPFQENKWIPRRSPVYALVWTV